MEKKAYKMPQIDVIDINTKLHLLAGSGQEVSAGITVDDMDEQED